MTTVTWDRWSVSAQTSSNKEGATLHVYRHHQIGGRYVIAPGDHNGRVFKTSEEAFSFARWYGYLQDFVKPWCRDCRKMHTFLNKKSSFCDVHKKFVK